MVGVLTACWEGDARRRRQTQSREIQIIESVVREQPFDFGDVRRCDIRDDNMLVRRQTELALVYLRDHSQRRLIFTAGLVLHAPILDEASEVVFAVVADMPAKVVDITVERKRPCRLELAAKTFLHFCLEIAEARTANRIL